MQGFIYSIKMYMLEYHFYKKLMEVMKMTITNFNETIAYFTYDKEKKREYVKLEDLFNEHGKDKVYTVLGLYINEGKFGEQGSAVLDDVQVNLPKHLVPVIKEIRSNEKLVDDINAGKVGFEIYAYVPRNYNITAYSIRWVDIETEDFTEVDGENIPF